MTKPGVKRSAYEPAERLLGHEAAEAEPVPPKRPMSTALGAIFVMARAASGVLWLVTFALAWEEIAQLLGGEMTADAGSDADDLDVVLWVVLVFGGLGVLALLVLGWKIWRGSNVARVLVMSGLTLSLISAATAHFAAGEQITLQTTLLTLSFDILVLLALSSRDARTWSRQRSESRRARRRAARA